MTDHRVFELRTYYTHPGRLADLQRRFVDHTLDLFARHGIGVVGFWTPTDGTEADTTLVYLLDFPDRPSADAAWEAFLSDPEWQRAKAASEAPHGPLVARIESTFLAPTAYSPLG
ncbi:MAG: NIPSNAP family protein [Propionibacteriaceae bacterium]